MKPERVYGISPKFQPSNPIAIHLHSSKTTTRFPFYSPSFSLIPRPIILPFFQKLVETSIVKIQLKVMSEEKRDSNDPSPPFQEKEKVPMLGGQWKEKEKVPMLGGQWKVPSLVVNGRKIIFTSSHFPPNQIYLNLQFFPLTLRFYFTMVLGHSSCVSFA
jgi:hypothetical protein